MVAFAVGGLMGDTLFHLLPEIFLGEEGAGGVRFVLVEPNRNLLLGLAILVGFMTFVAMDKGLRIATGGGGHEHSHDHHSHGREESAPQASSASSTAVNSASDSQVAKNRKKGPGSSDNHNDDKGRKENPEKEISPSVKLGGYLNLM